MCPVSLTAPAKEPPPAVIPPNHRAVAVKIDPADQKADFILPGGNVDVIQTQLLDSGKTVSKVVLESLLVLAVDVQTERKEPKKAAIRVITVAVHADDAARLAAAMKQGTVSLLLRKPEKESKPPVKEKP